MKEQHVSFHWKKKFKGQKLDLDGQNEVCEKNTFFTQKMRYRENFEKNPKKWRDFAIFYKKSLT